MHNTISGCCKYHKPVAWSMEIHCLQRTWRKALLNFRAKPRGRIRGVGQIRCNWSWFKIDIHNHLKILNRQLKTTYLTSRSRSISTIQVIHLEKVCICVILDGNRISFLWRSVYHFFTICRKAQSVSTTFQSKFFIRFWKLKNSFWFDQN